MSRSLLASAQLAGAKLKGRSAKELGFRARQALANIGERGALALGLGAASDRAVLRRMPGSIRSAEDLLAAFRAQALVAPIKSLRHPRETGAALGETARQEAVQSAEAILANRFVLFGGQAFDFGRPVNWHLEPRSRVTSPLRHWSTIDYLDPLAAGDKKLIWEINRQQYLLTLGRAYAATSDERFAAAFVDHVTSWIAANPPKVGINWASALEVAYRSIAWLWALHMFRDARAVTPRFMLDFVRVLEINGRHIERNLSTYFSPNTHLTGEALGLLYLGAMLPFLSDAARWRSLGRSILVEQLDKQVREDGTYFENATYYHRYALDICLNLAVLSEAIGEPLDKRSLDRIELLADALAAVQRPDGTHGFLGDDDGGRLLPLDAAAINDFRPALGSAAVLFRRSDFKAAAGELAEETIWLFGIAARDAFDQLGAESGAPKSRSLPEGGLFVMRDGGAGANHLVIDCGPHGALNCGHAHADALALELVAQGRPMLLDAGTYSYTGDSAARQAFRSTAYHNALTVDRQSSSEAAGPFSWRSIAQCRLLRWASGPRFDVFEGEHDGFMRLAEPAGYRRSILFVKAGYWILCDRVQSDGRHDYRQHFHFAPDAAPELAGEDVRYCRERRAGAPGLDIVSFAQGGSWEIEDGWVSARYGDRDRAKVAIFALRASKSADIVTFLLPRDPAGTAPLPSVVEARGGRVFELAGPDGVDCRDTFVVSDGGELTAPGLSCKADWVWLRRCGSTIDAIVAHRARHISVDGRRLLACDAPVSAAVWRDGGRFVADCEAGLAFEFEGGGGTMLADAAAMAEHGRRDDSRPQAATSSDSST